MAQARKEIKSVVLKYISNLQSLGISVQKVILFGSQTKGTFEKDSDIDIAVVSKEFEKMGLWKKATYLGRAAREIPYPIGAIGFSPSQLKKFKQGTILDEIIRNGVEVKI
ncbi:MAG: nucleotidyltransferase domain-containing protein [Thermodesulfovibrionia bacterium]